MKRFNVILLTLLLMFAGCVKHTADNSAYSDLFKDKFNQEITWDADSLLFQRADWITTDANDGAVISEAQLTLWGLKQNISYVSVPINNFIPKIASSDNADLTSNIARSNRAAFAINGSFFEGNTASTYLLIDEEEINAETSASVKEYADGFVGINENATGWSIEIGSLKNAENDLASEYTSAIVTGPVLVEDGKLKTFPQTPFFTERKARSIIGITYDNNLVFLTIDGKIAGYSDGADIAEAAKIADYMSLKDAVCLDGGDNSALYSEKRGLVSHPSSNGQFDAEGEQRVANAIFVVANGRFAGGTGTQDDPYLIANKFHIQNMPAVLELGKTVYFDLISDIDMKGIRWQPLNPVDPYTKRVVFDGNGHTIKNFTCEGNTAYTSFFGVLVGECRNTRFTNANVIQHHDSSCGILGGYIGTGNKPGLVENVFVQGKLHSDFALAGGIGGQIRDGIIQNSYVDVDVSVTATARIVSAGGIGGKLRTNSSIVNCYSLGTVVAENSNTGGICGYTEDSAIGISACIAWNTGLRGETVTGGVNGWQQTGSAVNSNSYFREDMQIYRKGVLVTSFPEVEIFNTRSSAYNGKPATDIIATAKLLGWSDQVWDFNGSMPELKWNTFDKY